MDVAPTASRDARRCARPECADLAAATLSFRYDRQQAWLTSLAGERTPATYDLCGPCADRTAPPRGWELVDERPDLDSRAAAPVERDAVRDAIAAALRQGSPPRDRSVRPNPLSVVPEPSRPVRETVAAPNLSLVAGRAASSGSLQPDPRAGAVSPATGTELPPRRRRRPVEVLIQANAHLQPNHDHQTLTHDAPSSANAAPRGPAAPPVSVAETPAPTATTSAPPVTTPTTVTPPTTSTTVPTMSARPGSHAPTSHRLAAAPMVSRARDDRPSTSGTPDAPPLAVATPEALPTTAAMSTPMSTLKETVPAVWPAGTVEVVEQVALAMDLPLAFDTMPERLVSLRPAADERFDEATPGS